MNKANSTKKKMDEIENVEESYEDTIKEYYFS